ncbi:MAG: hypothetical protein M1830_001879 [Pleopsidium flavum]|nr:MAG: hypothetical protein M1830_001879 [Pleopsidium flavum]
MAFTSEGPTLTRMQWADWDRLTVLLEMTSRKDLEHFIESNLFKPYFNELVKNVIRPTQQTTTQTKKPRVHEPDLRTVQSVLLKGEKAGERQFSCHNPDKSTWDAKDYYAYFLYCVCDENLNNKNGIFYGKGLSDTEIDTQVWNLLQRCTYDISPSRKGGSKGAQLTGNNPKKVHTEEQPLVQASPDRRSAPAENRDQPPVNSRRQLTPADNPDFIELLERPAIFGHGPALPSVGHGPALPSLSPEHTIKQEPGVEPPAEVDAGPGNKLVANPMSNAEHMYQERHSNVMDVADRWWRKAMIDQITRSTGGWEHVAQNFQHVYDDNRITSAQSMAWEGETRNLNAENTIKYTSFTDQSIAAFDKQETWFNNLNYQRQDITGACISLGIENQDIPWIPGMPRSCTFMSWQPVAIHAMRQMRLTNLQGCALADVVGLGKTWITLRYLQSSLNDRNNLEPELQARAKPSLIIVPVKLIDQWIDEIHRIVPEFTVYKYHGDRRAKPIGKEVIIGKVLKKNSFLFSGSPDNAQSLIITSYGTLAARHGVKAQFHWRTVSGQWNAVNATRKNKEYDNIWPSGLGQLFNTVVLDEAHSIKNEDTDINTAVSWLDSDFHLFLSATPLLAGSKDFGGFLKIIEPHDADQLWTPQNLSNLGLSKDVNLYTLDEDHSGAILCVIMHAAREFVFKFGISPPVQGSRLRKI